MQQAGGEQAQQAQEMLKDQVKTILFEKNSVKSKLITIVIQNRAENKIWYSFVGKMGICCREPMFKKRIFRQNK